MTRFRKNPLFPASLAANGIQGAGANIQASAYGAERSPEEAATLILALTATDVARSQSSLYAGMTDAPAWEMVDAAASLDRAPDPGTRGHAMACQTLKGCRAQCSACGEYFGSDRAFDRHRLGDFAKRGEWRHNRQCLTVAEMDATGWARNGRGFLLAPDARRAETAMQGPRVTLTATYAPARRRTSAKHAAPATCSAIEGA